MKLKFKKWGCDTCKQKFPKGIVPKHERHGIDLMDGGKWYTWTCEGSGKPAIGWYARVTESGYVQTGLVKKGWKPKAKR